MNHPIHQYVIAMNHYNLPMYPLIIHDEFPLKEQNLREPRSEPPGPSGRRGQATHCGAFQGHHLVAMEFQQPKLLLGYGYTYEYCTHGYIYIYKYCVCICIYVCKYVNICLYMYIVYVYIYVYIYMYIYVYAYVCLYVFMYKYVNI